MGAENCRFAEGRCRSMTFWQSKSDERFAFLRRVGEQTPTVTIKLPRTWSALLHVARQEILHGQGNVEHLFLGDGTEIEPDEIGLSRIANNAVIYVSAGETFAGIRVNPYIPLATARKFREEVRLAVQRTSSCVPGRGVMFSVVNRHMAPLRELGLHRVARMDCLMRRFVSLCLGGFRDAHGVCVDAPEVRNGRQLVDGGPAIRVEPFRSSAKRMRWSSAEYHKVTWAKWSLMHLALFEASYALCIDADVVLLRNPFAHVELSLVRGRALLIQVVPSMLPHPCLRSASARWRLLAVFGEADAASARAAGRDGQLCDCAPPRGLALRPDLPDEQWRLFQLQPRLEP